MCINGAIVTNKEVIAESFNAFFSSVFTDDDGRTQQLMIFHQ